MKKRLLPLLLLFAALASHSQDVGFPRYQSTSPGFPYNPDQPIFNSPYDTLPAVKKLNRAMNILSEFRIQAYIQPEWQRTDTAGGGTGSVKGISGVQGGQFPASANNRFIVRRGRFKLSYEHKNAQDLKIVEFAFQFDATEKGFNAIKDAYGRIIDPWTGWFGIQGGIFLRPFGFESPAPPAFYESPEFSRVNQTVLPNECELGEAIVIESPAKFTRFYFRADASLVNGEGVGASSNPGAQTGTYQSEKDFIGRIKMGKTFDFNGGSKVQHGLSLCINGTVSAYGGGVLQTTGGVYELENGAFTNIDVNHADFSNALRRYFKRQYYGAQLELKADYFGGTSTLRGEYISGIQPGTQTSSSVPTGAGNAVPGVDLYIRDFRGAMFYAVQSFKQHMHDGHTIFHDLTVKFDFYNPNTQVKQSQMTAGDHFTSADVEYSTLGFGYSFVPYNWFKLMIWYDHVMNADTQIPGFQQSYPKQDVLTIRTQFYIDTKWFGSPNKYTDNLMMKQY